MSIVLDEEYVSIAEAARLLGVHPTTIRRWMTEGSLAGYRVGHRRILLKRADLSRLITPARGTERQPPPVRMKEGPIRARLTEEEQREALEAMEAADRLRAEMAARYPGKVWISSDILLNEARDQRIRELDDLR